MFHSDGISVSIAMNHGSFSKEYASSSPLSMHRECTIQSFPSMPFMIHLEMHDSFHLYSSKGLLVKIRFDGGIVSTWHWIGGKRKRKHAWGHIPLKVGNTWTKGAFQFGQAKPVDASENIDGETLANIRLIEVIIQRGRMDDSKTPKENCIVKLPVSETGRGGAVGPQWMIDAGYEHAFELHALDSKVPAPSIDGEFRSVSLKNGRPYVFKFNYRSSVRGTPLQSLTSSVIKTLLSNQIPRGNALNSNKGQELSSKTDGKETTKTQDGTLDVATSNTTPNFIEIQAQGNGQASQVTSQVHPSLLIGNNIQSAVPLQPMINNRNSTLDNNPYLSPPGLLTEDPVNSARSRLFVHRDFQLNGGGNITKSLVGPIVVEQGAMNEGFHTSQTAIPPSEEMGPLKCSQTTASMAPIRFKREPSIIDVPLSKRIKALEAKTSLYPSIIWPYSKLNRKEATEDSPEWPVIDLTASPEPLPNHLHSKNIPMQADDSESKAFTNYISKASAQDGTLTRQQNYAPNTYCTSSTPMGYNEQFQGQSSEDIEDLELELREIQLKRMLNQLRKGRSSHHNGFTVV